MTRPPDQKPYYPRKYPPLPRGQDLAALVAEAIAKGHPVKVVPSRYADTGKNDRPDPKQEI